MDRAGCPHERIEPLAVSVEAARRLAGIGRTVLYEAMGRGDLPSCKVGKRRLILIKDLQAWLERQRQTQSIPIRLR